MIYILHAPSYFCQAISAVGNFIGGGCEKCVHAVTRECGATCGSACSFLVALLGGIVEMAIAGISGLCGLLRRFLNVDGPLGGFVLIALLGNVPSLIFAVKALLDPEVTQCTKGPLKMACEMDVGLAVAHMLFATYFKHRVEALGSTPHAPPTGTLDIAEGRNVRHRVFELAMYDIGFLLYVFVFCYSIYHNAASFNLVTLCRPHAWDSGWASFFQLVFAVLAVQYVSCWICVQGTKEATENVSLRVRTQVQTRTPASLLNTTLSVLSWRRRTNAEPVVEPIVPGRVIAPVLPESASNYVRLEEGEMKPSAPPPAQP